MFLSPVIGQLIAIVLPTPASTPETTLTAAYNTGLLPPENVKRAVVEVLSWKDSAGEMKSTKGLTVTISGNNVVVENGSSTEDYEVGDVLQVFVSVEASRSVTGTLS